MRVAALDLGSNTSLLMIADVVNGRIERVVHDETRVTRMGQGVHANRELHPEALARLRDCFQDYAKTIAANACEKVVAVATSAARDVKNAQALLDLGSEFKIPIHVISGEREANITFRGALSDRARFDGTAVIDVGGGSTEIISSSSSGVNGTSVDVGSVRLTELKISGHPVSSDELQAVRKYVENAFAQAPLPSGPFREIVAVAGTPVTLAMLERQSGFNEAVIHGVTLSLAKIDAWTDRLAKLTVAEREALPGMQPKRADVIVAGAIILSCALRVLGKAELTVSTRGVRYGVALAHEEIAP